MLKDVELVDPEMKHLLYAQEMSISDATYLKKGDLLSTSGRVRKVCNI